MVDLAERFWSKIQRGTDDECWLWLAGTVPGSGRSSTGYGHFWVEDRMRRTHRVAWELANGRPIPEGMLVRHSCDNGLCCNPAHLSLGTQLDNMADMYQRGRDRHDKGSARYNAKLTDDAVRQIRILLAQGRSQRKVAHQFDVSQATIKVIAQNRGWRHVPLEGLRYAFSVADARTGEWRHFEADLPEPIAAQVSHRQDRMTFLRSVLKDERFDGRAMIMVPR